MPGCTAACRAKHTVLIVTSTTHTCTQPLTCRAPAIRTRGRSSQRAQRALIQAKGARVGDSWRQVEKGGGKGGGADLLYELGASSYQNTRVDAGQNYSMIDGGCATSRRVRCPLCPARRTCALVDCPPKRIWSHLVTCRAHCGQLFGHQGGHRGRQPASVRGVEARGSSGVAGPILICCPSQLAGCSTVTQAMTMSMLTCCDVDVRAAGTSSAASTTSWATTTWRRSSWRS